MFHKRNLLALFLISACGPMDPNTGESSIVSTDDDGLFCSNLNGIPVRCDGAGKYMFTFNKAEYSLPFPGGNAGESTVFNSLPNVGTLSTDIDFKAASPAVWVGSGRQPGTIVSGPYWQTETQGLMSATFSVAAVLYKHEYTSFFKCLIDCPHPQIMKGPDFEEPSAGDSGIAIQNGEGSRRAAVINPDTPMFRIEIAVNGNSEIKDTKTFYWSDFVCKPPVPFTTVTSVQNTMDGGFYRGPMKFTESKRTPCVLNAGNASAWNGLGDYMRTWELKASTLAGTRGLEYRVTTLYPYYDFYVLFGKVEVYGYKG